jgi:hypothetical protein
MRVGSSGDGPQFVYFISVTGKCASQIQHFLIFTTTVVKSHQQFAKICTLKFIEPYLNLII